MATRYAREFQIELLFEERNDGIYQIHSPSLPGMRLAGEDFEALRRDIEPVVRDLLYHNKNIIAENIRWIPSLDEVQEEMTRPHDKKWRATYVITTANTG